MPVFRTSAFRRLADLARDRRGNVALMFGVMVLPMMGAIGLAIDFGSVMVQRTKAQMAADAAALQASGVARDLIKVSNGGDVAVKNAIIDAQKRGDTLFRAHADQSGLKNYTISTIVTKSAMQLTATSSFTVTTSTFLAKMFGPKVYTAIGKATSLSSLPTFSDVYLALDVSASMGIAGSQADMVKLWNANALLTTGKSEKTKCVFACHIAESGRAESNSAVAKKNSVVLRIDVLRDAVKAMLAEAQKDAESQPIYRFALYTLGGSLDASTWVLTKVATITDNFTTLNAAATTIDIQSSTTSASYQRSYINEQLVQMGSELAASGDGSEQGKSKKYVFLITDGARDVPPKFGSCTVPSGSGRCTNGIDSTVCKAIKDKGITMGVLYTTYIPVLNDPAVSTSGVEYWYNLEMVANKYSGQSVAARLAPSLKACASEGWYFEATEAAAISAAMKKMFEQTTHAPSLTH